MSKVFGACTRYSEINSELEQKIEDLMYEYIESYRKVVTETRIFPVYFPILTRIDGCFCVGDTQLYVFYERTQSGIAKVSYLRLKEGASPSLETLANELIGTGHLSKPSGFILPKKVLEMSPEKRKEYLEKRAEEDARSAIEQVKAGDTSRIIYDIIRLQEEANELLNREVFIDKFRIINGLFGIIRNFNEFITKIQNLNLLIDKIRVRELKDLIGKDKESLKGLKSISLLEAYLIQQEKDSQITKDLLGNLRDISTLSAGYPRHEGKEINKEVNKVIRKWGFNLAKVSYPSLWRVALEKYRDFLQKFVGLLS
jgi:hypothetical protein